MDNPSTSRADAAYDRALAAYQEKSYEVARRWVLEALAHNRQHANAKALLARLDAARRATSPFETPPFGSEVVSTDPTVLVTRASRSAAPPTEPIEPTVMIRRDDPPRRASDTDTHAPIRVPRPASQPVADPTVIAQPKSRSSSSRPKTAFSLGAAVQSLGERIQRRDTQTRPSSTGTRAPLTSSPAFRGAVIAIAAIVVGALLLWGAIGAFRWFFPAGQVLTIKKPANGTITGPGIECGTRGDDCETTFKTGEPVELAAEPDKGFVWAGYTGDCAPTGRLAMAGPRTCGATFEQVASAPQSVTFKLTIKKPEGGTVIAAGGILCGTLGSTCSAEIPSGQPVTLTARADDGFVWEQFTDDCPATGETTMTSAKTCGAVFAKTATPLANVGPSSRPVASAPPRPRPQPAPQQTPSNTAPPSPAGNNAASGGAPQPANPNPTPTSPTPPPTVPDKPAAAPISAEEHAKREIKELLTKYCSALQTLKPANLQPLFHRDVQREYKEKLKEYKSLKCALSGEPEWAFVHADTPAGGAQVKFVVKQNVEMKSGGAPQVGELNVTMGVSRKDFQSAWLIDWLQNEQKPKS